MHRQCPDLRDRKASLVLLVRRAIRASQVFRANRAHKVCRASLDLKARKVRSVRPVRCRVLRVRRAMQVRKVRRASKDSAVLLVRRVRKEMIQRCRVRPVRKACKASLVRLVLKVRKVPLALMVSVKSPKLRSMERFTDASWRRGPKSSTRVKAVAESRDRLDRWVLRVRKVSPASMVSMAPTESMALSVR